MDLQTLVNIGVGVVVPLVGWLVNSNHRLREDLHDFKLKAAETYVTHADLAEIKRLLERIDEKLDTKADK